MRKVFYIFGLLTDSDIDWIARVGARRRVKAGDTLIERGKPIDSILLVLEGQLLVLGRDTGVIARRGVGEVVGEMSMVDSAPPSATVIAEGECLILFLNKDALLRKLASDVAFGFRFYKALTILLADRLREMYLPGDRPQDLAAEAAPKDGSDLMSVESISVAGERLDRMLKVLTGISVHT
jgi:CRP/FNR family cyclic AMP-dependent transcriptional regulator